MKRCLLIYFGFFALFSGCHSQSWKYLDFIQKLDSPDGKNVFALYYGIAGGGDHEFHIFKFPKNMDPEQLTIPRSYWSHNADKEARKWTNYSLLFNWSEDGSHSHNPEIKLFKDRYLVLIRGGLYHSLYDIKTNNTILNFDSPWHEYVYSDEYESLKPKPTHSQRKKLLENWKKKYLHNPISKIVDN